jgi:hypothetical protein
MEAKAGRPLEQPESEVSADRHQRPADPYRLVLEELQRKRQELDVAISAIEQMIAESDVGDRSLIPAGRYHARAQPRVAEAVRSVLESLGRPVRNAEIKSALLASGYKFTAGDPDVSIVQALNRLSTSNVVVKIGRGLWAKRA